MDAADRTGAPRGRCRSPVAGRPLSLEGRHESEVEGRVARAGERAAGFDDDVTAATGRQSETDEFAVPMSAVEAGRDPTAPLVVLLKNRVAVECARCSPSSATKFDVDRLSSLTVVERRLA